VMTVAAEAVGHTIATTSGSKIKRQQ
jgi:hypothetical protein